MKKIQCYSVHMFNRIMNTIGWNDNNLPPNNVAIISIIGENEIDDDSFHWFKHDHDNVLNLDFDDIDGDSPIWDNYYHTDDGGIIYKGDILRPISKLQGDKITKFINDHIGCTFYIHCYAGVSRSQAVVRYILDSYPDIYTINDCRDDNPPVCPNQYVLVTLKRSLRENNYYEI